MPSDLYNVIAFLHESLMNMHDYYDSVGPTVIDHNGLVLLIGSDTEHVCIRTNETKFTKKNLRRLLGIRFLAILIIHLYHE